MKNGRKYAIALIALLAMQSAIVGFASAQNRVFRCEVNGKVVYSDFACSATTEKTEVDTEIRNIASAPDPTELDSSRKQQPQANSNRKRSGSSNTFVRVPDNSAALMFGQGNHIKPPEAKRTNNSKKSPGQIAMEKSANYRADPPPDGWQSGPENVSIADSLAKHKEACQAVSAELYEVNHTATETRYTRMDGSVDVVEHGKDKEKISSLEQKLKRHKCR